MRKLVFGLVLLAGLGLGATYALAGGDPEPTCVAGTTCEAWRVDWRLGPPLSDQYQPSKVVGEVALGSLATPGTDGTVDIYAFNWGASTEISPVGGGGGQGRSEQKDFTFVKAIDEISPRLARLCQLGIFVPELEVRINARNGTMVYEFAEVSCALDKHGGTGQPTTFPIEEFTFSYAAANLEFVPSNNNGNNGR
jgi:type VI protein secretion system component Hcp